MIISAMMQPTDHTSMALEYWCEPRTISGARYHLVAMYSVRICWTPSSSSLETDLASPKSAILTRQSVLSKMFEGFKSKVSLQFKSPAKAKVALTVQGSVCTSVDDVGRMDVLQSFQDLVDHVLLVDLLEDIASNDRMQVDLHELEHQVQVVRVLSPDQSVELHDVLVVGERS